jgi:signal peptidase I
MSGNRMLINGETISYEPIREEVAEQIRNYIPLEADYAEENLEGRQHSIMLLRGRAFPSGFSSVTVPESQYFVMGDNRRNSKDSRVFGFVDRGEILGEATTVVLSLDYKKYFKPRWNRFFLKLR